MGSKRITLSEFAIHQKGFAFKSNDYQNNGVAVVRVSNFTNDSIDISDLKFVNADVANDKAAFELLEDDVVIATVGSWPNNPASVVGKVIRVPANASKSLLNQNAVRLRPLSNDANDLQFLFYLLKDKTFSDYIVSTAQGSANQASITLKDIYAYEFDCPDYQSRKLIAKNLYALDMKITLNRQINQTLEQMAQTLFKSWFVDFDPVIDNALDAGNDIPDTLQERAEQRRQLRAKADFKPLPAETRALFPSEFEETELGWVPKGWEVRKIKEFAVVIKGISYKSSELTESKTALVTLKSFNRGGGYRLDGLKEYSGKYKTEQIVKAGDLVVAYTDVTQAADIIGKPALVVDNPKYEKLVISLDVSVVRTNLDIYKTFFYNLMKTEAFQNHTLSYTSGTTVLHLSKDAVPEYEFFCPNVELVEVFDNIVNKHYSSINLNINENIMLENIRNTLLPKLISGELALDDLPEEIAEAAEAL